MKQLVDARGLACPQPVIHAKKALETNDCITLIVDNETARENIRRMAASSGFSLSEEDKPDGIYLNLIKTYPTLTEQEAALHDAVQAASRGPKVLVISQDVMGKGDDSLGTILIKNFFHTLAETSPEPDIIIFFNSGVKLVALGSEVIEDIKILEGKGTRLLSCGTCLDFFNIKDKLQAGKVSNMYEIKELMLSASSVINL
jgi:selenium metabolism protein YedF